MLESKLRFPRTVSRPIPRPQLDDVLERGATVPLTLVSAPAGYGKTTLVASWLQARPSPAACAWVSLDEHDRDATSFWSYVLSAVERVAPGTAGRALGMASSGRAGLRAALDELLNELSVLPADLTVVLDDYHLCDGTDVGEGMSFLLEHLPPQVHVIIITRADPGLPLSRLRARGQLVELRAGDLRFTVEESAAYLNDAHDLHLDPAAVAVLDRRTEGWAAAVHLAALSLRGRADPAGFISAFAGDDRFVLDYLADEVLGRVPEGTRRFLLETSILDRLTGALCDAVTGASGGKAMLEALERQNLFLIPLDDHRRWYRYHHLFADVLKAHLLDERRTDLPQLHRRASDWFAEQDDPEPAVHHALAARDIGRAAELVELAVPRLRRARKEALILRWAADLPEAAVRDRPVLATGIVGALMASNQFDGVARRLDEVERRLENPDDLVIVDRAERARLPAAIHTYRAALALTTGDLTGTMAHAEAALARGSEDDLLSTAAASALIGLASWAQGDLARAHEAYTVAARELGVAGHIADALGCTITLADLATAQGRLRDAGHVVHEALEAAGSSGAADALRGTADMHVALAALDLERGHLASAAEHLRRSDELGDAAGLPQNAYRWRVTLAGLREAHGDTDSALVLLGEAERVYVGDFAPNVRPIAATRARVLAAAGRTEEALAWARSSGLGTTDAVSYLKEYEHTTLVRVLLAAGGAPGSTTSEAADLLDRLIAAALAGRRTGSLIELLVLKALACQATGAPNAAADALERAVRLAEPEGYCRVFTAEGPAMATLLDVVAGRHPGWSYVRRLRTAIRRGDMPDSSPGASSTRSAPDRPAALLVEPLSNRELDILRYLGSELDGPAIARELSVSLSTVRTHTQHIYGKLGVNNRRAAIRRAHQLGLFPRTHLG